MIYFVWRNLKWRFQNPISIIITIIQPLLWLVLYSSVASGTIENSSINNYTAFILPGIIVLTTFFVCGSGGYLNYIMMNNGSFYRILIAPVSRNNIILGYILEVIIVSFLEVGILFIVSLLLGVKIASGILGVIIIMVFIIIIGFFYGGITYVLSMLLPNEVIYETVISSIVLPVFFLSSALFPVEKLSGFLGVLIKLNPFTHVINVYRSIIFNEIIDIKIVIPVILLFCILGIISFSLARWSLKKQTIS